MGPELRLSARRCPVTEVMEGNEQEFEIYRAFEHITCGDFGGSRMEMLDIESSAIDIDKSI